MNIFNACLKHLVKNALHHKAIVDGVSSLRHAILVNCKMMIVKICVKNGYLMNKDNVIKDHLEK